VPTTLILLSTIAQADDAALSANKILTALAMPHHVKEHDLQITVSMGYYFQRPVAANEFAKLLGSDLSTTVLP